MHRGPQEKVVASHCSRRFGVLPRRVQFAADLDRADEHLDHEAEAEQIEDHLCMPTTRATWLVAVMSPKPTVAKTVTVKYSADRPIRRSFGFVPAMVVSGCWIVVARMIDRLLHGEVRPEEPGRQEP